MSFLVSKNLSMLIGIVIGFAMATIFLQLNRELELYVDHHFTRRDQKQPQNTINNTTNTTALDNATVADQLYRDVRVLCWIMTNPQNHKLKAIHIKRTWARRCNKVLFMSSEADPELDSIALPVREGRDYLWEKTREAFRYIHQHHFDEADWFLKADDDTFTIVENLRFMLAGYDAQDPIYFGCKFKAGDQIYMSGGAGYVLSKEAVRRFVEDGLGHHSAQCKSGSVEAEDYNMGECLQHLQVFAGDSRDSEVRGRFFAFLPETHLVQDVDRGYWYWRYLYYPTEEGLDGLSHHAISFHYIPPGKMYELDYLIYQLRAYGVEAQTQPLPRRKQLHELMEERVEMDKRTPRPRVTFATHQTLGYTWNVTRKTGN